VSLEPLLKHCPQSYPQTLWKSIFFWINQTLAAVSKSPLRKRLQRRFWSAGLLSIDSRGEMAHGPTYPQGLARTIRDPTGDWRPNRQRTRGGQLRPWSVLLRISLPRRSCRFSIERPRCLDASRARAPSRPGTNHALNS